MTAYRFAFRSSFAGVVDYDCFDGRFSIGRVSVTVSLLSDYWRKYTNNPAQADSSLNILRWHGGTYGEPAPADMVAAFNAWQKVAEREAAKAECARKWPKDWEQYFPPAPAPVTAGRFDSASGLWEPCEPARMAA